MSSQTTVIDFDALFTVWTTSPAIAVVKNVIDKSDAHSDERYFQKRGEMGKCIRQFPAKGNDEEEMQPGGRVLLSIIATAFRLTTNTALTVRLRQLACSDLRPFDM